jgi:hypothetical protein
METDRLLIAINNLIEAYEAGLVKLVSEENESNLDVMQISNLHKMEMIVHGMELGNSVDLMLNISGALRESEEARPIFETQQSAVVASEEEECVLEESLTKIYKSVTGAKDWAEDKISEGVDNIPQTKWKIKASTLNGKISDFRNKIEAFNNKEFQDCLDCRPSFSEEDLIPAYEVNWELKQFLANLKSLLIDINDSLDPTKIMKDFCNWYSALKETGSCFHNWPIIVASFPIIINDLRVQLTGIGVSWTGIVGPLIAPFLTSLTNILEALRNMSMPLFNCLLRLLNTSREVILQARNVLNQYADRSINTYESISNTFSTTRKNGAKVAKSEMSLGSKLTNAPKIDTKLDEKIPFSTFDGINEGFSFTPKFVTASGFVKSSNINKRNNVAVWEALINAINTIIYYVSRTKDIVEGLFNKYIYLLKSLSRLIIEPLFISTKLIGEIKNIFNIIRLFSVFFEINWDDPCKGINDENTNRLNALLSKIDLEVQSNELTSELKSEEEFLTIKAKNSSYKSRFFVNDCGDILKHVNHNQIDIDSLYDKITGSLG